MAIETAPLIFSDFGELEFFNALELRVFRKELTATQVKTAQKAFQTDILEGHFSVSPLSGAALTKARQLSKQHCAKLGTRTLDLLHVAAAICLGAKTFASFDQKQTALAATAGLRLLL